MIYLEKNSHNQIILELTLSSSLVSPIYVFEFINDIQPNNITYFTATDLSTFKCRYNRFDIVESGTTYSNPTGGVINLLSGGYTYNIYESSASTLSISATTGEIISTGKGFVNGIDTELPEVYR